MAKYHLMWEADVSKFPTDPKELMEWEMKTLESIKQALKDSGTVASDWGCFLSGNRGYAIGEGDAAAVAKAMWQFTPYYKFEVQQVLSIDEVIDITKSLMG